MCLAAALNVLFHTGMTVAGKRVLAAAPCMMLKSFQTVKAEKKDELIAQLRR